MTKKQPNSKNHINNYMNNVIYKHTCKISGKYYIGQTINSMYERWKKHISDATNNIYENNYFHRAIRKYGHENWNSTVLFHIVDNLAFNDLDLNNKSEEEIKPIKYKRIKEILNDAEIKLIKINNSTNQKYGYNSNIGGSNKNLLIINSDIKRKMSESQKYINKALGTKNHYIIWNKKLNIVKYLYIPHRWCKYYSEKELNLKIDNGDLINTTKGRQYKTKGFYVYKVPEKYKIKNYDKRGNGSINLTFENLDKNFSLNINNFGTKIKKKRNKIMKRKINTKMMGSGNHYKIYDSLGRKWYVYGITLWCNKYSKLHTGVKLNVNYIIQASKGKIKHYKGFYVNVVPNDKKIQRKEFEKLDKEKSGAINLAPELKNILPDNRIIPKEKRKIMKGYQYIIWNENNKDDKWHVYTPSYLKKYSKKYLGEKLCPSALLRVGKGKSKSHKGWKCILVKEKDKITKINNDNQIGFIKITDIYEKN